MAGQGVGAQVYLQWFDLNISMMKSWCLKAVVDLGLPDILAKAGKELTAFETAQELPSETVNVDYLFRIMTYAASLGIFKIVTPESSSDRIDGHVNANEETKAGAVGDVRKKMLEQRRFGTTALTMALTEECSPSPNRSLANIAKFFYAKLSLEPCYEVAEAVLTGKQPFHLAHGDRDAWDLSREMPEWGASFNKAMASFSVNHMDFILQSYKGFEGIQQLVDVGGGLGASLEATIRAHPDIRGINFDLPFVIAQAPEIAGVRHVGGDMFQSVPEGDAIFMKWVLHDWTDEQCVQILKNCSKALPSDGKVILAEYILPPVDEVKRTDTQFHADLVMMVLSQGKERTKAEFQRILADAGFPRMEVFSTAVLSVIEGYKA